MYAQRAKELNTRSEKKSETDTVGDDEEDDDEDEEEVKHCGNCGHEFGV
jgi:hypothetical protein